MQAAVTALIGDADEHVDVRISLQHRLGGGEGVGRQHALVLRDNLGAGRDLLQRLDCAADPLPPVSWTWWVSSATCAFPPSVLLTQCPA